MTTRRTINEMLNAARSRLERLEPAAAHDSMRDGALLVDTRCSEAREATGVIPGSVHVPLSVLFWRLDPASGHDDPKLSDPERQVVLLCAHGYSSSLAAATLRDLGFCRATDVVGGFDAWAAAGLPVEPLAEGQERGRVSAIRTSTITPDPAVSAATTAIAVPIPDASAMTPATTAPTAKPRSRQSR